MAETDLISRADAINAIVAHISDNIMPFPTQKGMMTAVKILENLSSAEPKIIRCKDCEYFRTPKDENNYCDHDFAGIRHVPFDDDYCSYAERKRDAD